MTIIAIVLGLSALAAQPQDLPELFQTGAIEWSAPLATDGFIGLVWVCDPAEAGDYSLSDLSALDRAELRAVALDPSAGYAETCYSGLDTDTGLYVTGP